MRKQRKMGHITIVGPSLGNVESNLAIMVQGNRLGDKSAVAPSVGIIMGSDSDLPVMKSAAEVLEMFDVPHEVRIALAHRTPEMMFSYASSAHDRGIQVIIAGAGGAAHLPGMVAALTPLPVIGVPVRASSLDGIDSLLSIVQMPKGVPAAMVAINNGTNAGLLAVRMLGVANDDLLSRMSQYQEDKKETVLRKGDKLEKRENMGSKDIRGRAMDAAEESSNPVTAKRPRKAFSKKSMLHRTWTRSRALHFE